MGVEVLAVTVSPYIITRNGGLLDLIGVKEVSGGTFVFSDSYLNAVDLNAVSVPIVAVFNVRSTGITPGPAN